MGNLGLFSGPGGPAYDQSQLRTNDSLQNQQNQEKLNQMYLQNMQSEVMNPLLAQNQTLQNQFQGSKNLGEEGLAKQHVAQGNIAEAGRQDAIGVNAAKATSDIGSEGVKQMQQYGDAFSSTGSILNQMPPGPHTTAIVQNMFDKLGVKADSPIHQAILDLPPEQMGAKLSSIGEQMALHAKSQIQMQANLGIKQQTAFGVQDRKSDSADSIMADKLEAQKEIATMNNETKLKIAAQTNALKELFFKNKVLSSDQLVAKATQEYQANPTEQNKTALDQATQIKAYTNGQQGKLVEAMA